MSLERGVLDGCASEPGYLVPTKIHEVGKFFLTNPLYCGAPFLLAVNQKVWDSFPDDIKSVMESCFKQFSIDWIESAIETRKDLEDAMKRDGVVFNTISPEEYARWKEKSKSAVAKWIERMNKLGYPGQEIVDIAMEVIENNKK
jgi:TRAP-type C4-dicarboxylate transport system substrate-binding protein